MNSVGEIVNSLKDKYKKIEGAEAMIERQDKKLQELKSKQTVEAGLETLELGSADISNNLD